MVKQLTTKMKIIFQEQSQVLFCSENIDEGVEHVVVMGVWLSDAWGLGTYHSLPKKTLSSLRSKVKIFQQDCPFIAWFLFLRSIINKKNSDSPGCKELNTYMSLKAVHLKYAKVPKPVSLIVLLSKEGALHKHCI